MVSHMIGNASLTDADRAYEQIKEMIVTLEMRPGTVIHEPELRDDLGFGRTPIREALKRLQSENLVIVKPRRGIFVADISITDLSQIFEVRIELEALCARLAAERITPGQLVELRRLVEEYEQIDPANLKDLFDIDRRFHNLLAAAANNDFLTKEMALFHNLSLRIWYLALSRVRAEDVDVQAHVDILAACESRDPDCAEARMREHINHFHRTIKRHL